MKRWIACMLALILAVSMVACGQQEASAPTENTKPLPEPVVPAQKVIHVLVPEAKEGWQAKAAAVAAEAAEAIKAEGKHDVVVSTYTDAKAQQKLLEDLAAKSIKDGSLGVVVMPAAGDMDTVFAKLLEANVSYAMADTIVDAAAAASVTNVICDQKAIGAATAALLVQNGLTEEENVVIVQGLSGEEALRTEGFRLYLQGKLAHDGVMIEAPWESLDNLVYSEMQGETVESAENYFTTYMEDSDHADAKFLVTWDDAYMLGILEALEGEKMDEDNKEEFLEGKPVMVSCGGSQALLDIMAGKTQNASAASFGSLHTAVYPADLLKIAVEAMAANLNGEVVPHEIVKTIAWANAENASQYQGY